MRVLFVNENIGGHTTVHAHLRRVLETRPEVQAQFIDVPSPSFGRRLLGTRVPGLAKWDADLQPLRAQLALSAWVRRRVREARGTYDALHVYTGNAGLWITDELAAHPSLVSTDATNATNHRRLPYRAPSTMTPTSVRISQRFEQPVYDAATLLLPSTAWVAGSLRDDYGIDDDRVRVHPFGIIAPDFGPGPAPGTAAATEGRLPSLVFVGRQLERKGALRLLALHQQHLADLCELVLVTPERAPAGRNVRVVSDVTVGSPRLWEELRGAAVFAFPSLIDQAPNAVIEAFAAGLPVVGIDQGPMTEMVPPEVGHVVPPWDDRALVEVLRHLVTSPEARQQLGAAARTRFEAKYDAQVTTSRLLDLFGEARERHRGRVAGERR